MYTSGFSGLGAITRPASGTIVELKNTPLDGQVVKFTFSTATSGYDNDGLTTALDEEHFVYRHNQTFIVYNVLDVQRLTIRPSTAFEFDEKPGFTYRTTTFTARDHTMTS